MFPSLKSTVSSEWNMVRPSRSATIPINDKRRTPICLTALSQWSVVLSYDKVQDVFRWKQGIRSVFRRIQKIRTPLLSEKSSDFAVVVHLQGLEPWAH